jgi:hypothetical protein
MKYFFLFFICFALDCYGQIAHVSTADFNGLYQRYASEFITIRDTQLMNVGTGKFIEGAVIKKGTIFYPDFFGEIVFDINGYYTRKDIIDFNDGTNQGYIFLCDVAIFDSTVFPDEIINDNESHYWIPAYTIDIIQNGRRDTIFKYERGRPEKGYDIDGVMWYEDGGDPSPLQVGISNTAFTFEHLNDEVYQFLESINYNNQYFTLTFPIVTKDRQKAALHLVYKEFSYIENIPNFNGPETSVLLLELNAANNRMRIYNGETKRIVFDLIKVSAEFYDKYIQFIKTEEVPRDLVIPQDLLAGWPGDIKIAPPYGGGRIYYTAAANLRLRSTPDTTGEIITTIQRGEKVLPLEPGLSGTIEGIQAPWVYVQTRDDLRGWCFAGYLEVIKEEPPAAREESGPDFGALNPDTPPPEETETPAETSGKNGFPLAVPLVAGGILAGIIGGLAAGIRRKKT